MPRIRFIDMNIYVGNLSYSTKDSEVRELFERFGEVQSVSVITDKFTGKPKGFAFVEMPDSASAKEAINGLNGVEINARQIVVNEARPRTERSNSFGNGGGGGGRRRF